MREMMQERLLYIAKIVTTKQAKFVKINLGSNEKKKFGNPYSTLAILGQINQRVKLRTLAHKFRVFLLIN